MSWSVGEAAQQSGVSVRSLHHYDTIGLLHPSGRTSAGYRQYEYADLVRLQRIVAYRSLGLGLDEIARLLSVDTADPVEHLLRHRVRLTAELARLRAQRALIDTTVDAWTMGTQLTPDELFEVFGVLDPAEHEPEAQQRWGDTDAYRSSHRRTAQYTKADWLTITAATSAIEQRFVDLLATGAPASGPEAGAAAEAHRQNITTWYYDCSYDIHRGLAEMYVADERFAAHYDALAPGLSTYVHDAIVANANANADAAPDQAQT